MVKCVINAEGWQESSTRWRTEVQTGIDEGPGGFVASNPGSGAQESVVTKLYVFIVPPVGPVMRREEVCEDWDRQERKWLDTPILESFFQTETWSLLLNLRLSISLLFPRKLNHNLAKGTWFDVCQLLFWCRNKNYVGFLTFWSLGSFAVPILFLLEPEVTIFGWEGGATEKRGVDSL